MIDEAVRKNLDKIDSYLISLLDDDDLLQALINGKANEEIVKEDRPKVYEKFLKIKAFK